MHRKNVVNISGVNVRFGARIVKRTRSTRRNDVEYIDKAAIVLVNQNNKRRVKIHKLTSFIDSQYGKTGINNQYDRAKQVAAFLNHVCFEHHALFRLQSLADLDIQHAVHFLDHKRHCNIEAINQYDKSIMTLYYFLCKKGLLKNFTLDMFQWREDKRYKRKSLISLFKRHLERKPKKPRADNKAKKLADHHVIPFIYTALRAAPDIALAIYLTFYGGLRASEAMSVKRGAIKSLGVFGEDGLIVKLKTDTKFAKGTGNQVKQPGSQMIKALNNLLRVMYQTHLQYYPDPIDGSDSLFVNSEGRAMQYESFRKRFSKVKEEFIRVLKDSEDSTDNVYATYYAGLKWSTHIGRGIYSNRVAEQCSNLIQLMNARRDKTPYASIHYLVATDKQRNQLNESLENMYEPLTLEEQELVKQIYSNGGNQNENEE